MVSLHPHSHSFSAHGPRKFFSRFSTSVVPALTHVCLDTNKFTRPPCKNAKTLSSLFSQHRRLCITSTIQVNGASHHSVMDHLSSTLKSVGLGEISTFANAYPALNPVDIYRVHLAETLAPITGADAESIYATLAWPQTLDKGDLVLPVPALRIKGSKPDDICQLIVDQVHKSFLGCTSLSNVGYTVPRFSPRGKARVCGHFSPILL